MKNKLIELNTALKALHRRFLENEKQEIEKKVERKLSPFDFLNILTADQNFVWLKPFSNLLLDIDDFLSDTEIISANDLVVIRDKVVKALYQPDSKIFIRFEHYLNIDGEFVLLNSKVNSILSSFIKNEKMAQMEGFEPPTG